MIQGYQRKPTKFDWCDTTVWLLKLTKAERDAAFGEGNKALFVDVVILTLTDENGTLKFSDRAAAIEYFDKEVAEDDFLSLGKLALKHSGFDLDKVEYQKKS